MTLPLCVRLLVREDSRREVAWLSSACEALAAGRCCSSPRSCEAKHRCVHPPIPVASLLEKVISGLICRLGLVPLVTDPNLLLSYFFSAEHIVLLTET